VPSLTLPIFNMALASYEQTVQTAFREASDALVEHQKRREFRIQQGLLVDSLRDAARLADIRYKGGVTSYLEVLDTERQLFDAELEQARAQRDELLALVRLYRALGGGWTPAS
jgi:multidrug efflux system outer membrane protein